MLGISIWFRVIGRGVEWGWFVILLFYIKVVEMISLSYVFDDCLCFVFKKKIKFMFGWEFFFFFEFYINFYELNNFGRGFWFGIFFIDF